MKAKDRGFIQLIIILALLVVILSLLGVSLSALFGNPILQTNFSFIWDGLSVLWDRWLGAPAQAVWDFISDFTREFVWGPLSESLNSLRQGEVPSLTPQAQ